MNRPTEAEAVKRLDDMFKNSNSPEARSWEVIKDELRHVAYSRQLAQDRFDSIARILNAQSDKFDDVQRAARGCGNANAPFDFRAGRAFERGVWRRAILTAPKDGYYSAFSFLGHRSPCPEFYPMGDAALTDAQTKRVFEHYRFILTGLAET